MDKKFEMIRSLFAVTVHSRYMLEFVLFCTPRSKILIATLVTSLMLGTSLSISETDNDGGDGKPVKMALISPQAVSVEVLSAGNKLSLVRSRESNSYNSDTVPSVDHTEPEKVSEPVVWRLLQMSGLTRIYRSISLSPSHLIVCKIS